VLPRSCMRRASQSQQCANAFLQCSDPQALQKLADSLTADDLITCAQKWLTRFTPFFTHYKRAPFWSRF
jgi:hypothetical protein